jgi:hypothetical protein
MSSMLAPPSVNIRSDAEAQAEERSKTLTDSRRYILDSENFLAVVKFIFIVTLSVMICAIGLNSPNDIMRSRRQFKSWYSQYVYQLKATAEQHCQAEYSIYLYGTRANTSNPTISGAGQFTLFVQPMINCILENISEYIKYQLSSSQVILGITPTIIALLGTSSEELCFLALIGRRRLLGVLIAAASPSIYTERAFKYQEPESILKERLHEKTNRDGNDTVDYSEHVKSTMEFRWFFVLLEYAAVFAAMINIATVNWELGVKSVSAVNPNTVLLPMMWSLLGISVHLSGAVVFNMRARRLPEKTALMPRWTLRTLFHWLSNTVLDLRHPTQALRNVFQTFRSMVEREFCLKTKGKEEKMYFGLIPESRAFTLLAWIVSISIIFHIILGTLILSSTNFVGPKNALGILARYSLSVVVCRLILVYELAVIRVEYQNAGYAKSGR